MDEKVKKTVDEQVKLYQEGFKAGADHTHMSPETRKEIDEMRNEWSEMKKMFRKIVWAIFSLILGFVVTAATYGIWVGDISVRIFHNEQAILKASVERHEIIEDVQKQEVLSAKIDTRLTAIELLLKDIKNSLK